MRAAIIGAISLVVLVMVISLLYPHLAGAPVREQELETTSGIISVEAPDPLATTRQLAADNTAFGIDLYNQFRVSDGNLFFSPYSISQAFAMLYAGARGETAEEMAKVLHITLDNDELHEAYRTQSEGLFERKKTTVDEKFKLNIANGLWTQEGFPIRDNFVTLLNEYYQSEPAALDFTNDTEQSRRTINEWGQR